MMLLLLNIPYSSREKRSLECFSIRHEADGHPSFDELKKNLEDLYEVMAIHVVFFLFHRRLMKTLILRLMMIQSPSPIVRQHRHETFIWLICASSHPYFLCIFSLYCHQRQSSSSSLEESWRPSVLPRHVENNFCRLSPWIADDYCFLSLESLGYREYCF